MIKNFFKSAWRSIIRQRTVSLINIFGLAIGMWAAMLIFMWVQNEFSYDRHYADSKNTYLVKSFVGLGETSPSVWENSPYMLGLKAQEQLPEVVKMTRIGSARYQAGWFNIKGNFTKETSSAFIDSSWFEVFPAKVISGSIRAFNENPYSIILTEKKAKQYFGNANPIGEIIRIDTADFRVQAVIADNPTHTSFRYESFLPIALQMLTPQGKKNILHWGNYNYLTFLQLLPAANPVKVEQKLTDIVLRERNREKKDMAAGLISLADMHFDKSIDNPSLIRGDRKTVTIFSVLGILLLIIACINYVNLTTARATLRIKEVSIRKIVGAERKQLLAQFVLESLLISVIALLIAMTGVYISLPFFNQLTENEFTLSAYSSAVWLVAGGTLLVSVILSSIYPALLLSSFRPIAIFSGRNIFSLKSVSLRKVLVTSQFTLSVILIICTIVVYRQMQFISKQSDTFNKSQVFSFNLPFSIYRKYQDEERMQMMDRMAQQLTALSSVAGVTRTNGGSVINMTSWSSGNNNDWDGRQKDFEPKISFFETDSSFKSLLNLQVADGRWFLPGTADQHNVILNETAVKEFGIRQPVIGQRFTARGDTGVIVGVVKDFYYKKLQEKTGPVVILNQTKYASTYLVKSHPGRTIEARDQAEKIWKQAFINDPFPYQFLNDEFETLYRTEKKVFLLVQIFSFLAIFISCLGLFGLAAFTAERRQKEIGIRKVIGASVPSIVSLISKEFVMLILIAFVIASPLAWWAMDSWLQDFAYRTSVSWWIFALAGAVTILIAFATLSYHAIRAAMANPVKALRTE